MFGAGLCGNLRGLFCGVRHDASMNGWIQETPRQKIAFQGQGTGFSLRLKRNCSISPARLTVEVCESDSVRRHEFNPARAS